MRIAPAGLALVAIPAAAPPAFAQSSPVAKQRLVLQVSDAEPGKWKLALNNARNVQQDLNAQNVKVEIVAYGPGIGMPR